MDPIFTLSYPEYSVAQQLAHHFPTARGYSLFAPLSRQEKGVDLVLSARHGAKTRVATIQVKSSRTYSRQAPTERTKRLFQYYTWFNRFEAPKEADFVLLIAVYPPEEARASRRHASWWAPVIMVFSGAEMRSFLKTVKTREGKPDRMFGFGFDSPDAIFQTRGDKDRKFNDYSSHLLSSKSKELERFLRCRGA